MASASELAAHWDNAYRDMGGDNVGWYQPEPEPSLSFITSLGLAPDAPIVDVGGGASLLVDRLVGRGFTDVTVVDISRAGLEEAETRLLHAMPALSASAGARPRFVCADIVREWSPGRAFRLWHDRAVFHFLTADADREAYWDKARASVEIGGYAVVGGFAEDGPTMCSGLPVRRHSADELVAAMGSGWQEARREKGLHTTPGGKEQQYVWIVAKRV
jgi:hypothetical protein